MIFNIFTFLPFLILLIISILVLHIAFMIIHTYLNIEEPIFIHAGIIFIFLFVLFFTGAVGVLFQLDQLTHPLFNYNLLALSMTYTGVGFIYRNLKQGSAIILDYSILLLGIAPMYAIALLLGLEFSPVPAILSQIIPLIIVLLMDRGLLKRVNNSLKTEKNNQLLQLLQKTFVASRIIHFIGLISMFAFIFLFYSGQEIQIEQIWGENWKIFDFVYFIALTGLMILFALFNRYVRNMAQYLLDVDSSQIINALLE